MEFEGGEEVEVEYDGGSSGVALNFFLVGEEGSAVRSVQSDKKTNSK